MAKLNDEIKRTNSMKLTNSMKKVDSEDMSGSSTILKTSVDDIAKSFSRHKYLMLDVDATSEFIGVEPSEQIELSETYPIYMNGIVAKSVLHYLDKNGFKVLYEKNFKWGEREIPMEYGEMIMGRGITENHIIKGMQFAKREDGIKVVVNINFAQMVGFLAISFEKKYMDMFNNALKEISRYIDELDYMRGEKISASGALLNVSEYSWSDVALESGIRETLEANILNFFSKAELYRINGIPFKKGVILEGPPGTGKTLIGKILANKIDSATFILSTAKDISTSEDVANLFRMARRLAPTVIFMEDIDFFGPSRQAGKVMRVTGELLNQMDGIEDNNGILIVATTNHPEMIDDAIMRRPGRFDVRVEVGALGFDNIEKLLVKFLDGRQKTEDVNFSDIARMCEGFNGSHIKHLANDVCIHAVNGGSMDETGHIILLKEHFIGSIERIRKHMGFEEVIDDDDYACEVAEKTSYVKSDSIEVAETAFYVKGSTGKGYVKGFNGHLFKKSDVEEITRKRL